jgi:hypothetical protein
VEEKVKVESSDKIERRFVMGWEEEHNFVRGSQASLSHPLGRDE